MTTWALVPIKGQAERKTRLGDALPAIARGNLVRSMLTRVLTVLETAPCIDAVALVSPEPETARAGIHWFADRGTGLNEALSSARDMACSRGATTLVILLPDVPLIEAEDIIALVAAMPDHGMAIAPDRHGEGTNALCLPATLPLPLRFGRDSFAAHLAAAQQLGIEPAIVRREGLGFDIDSGADLAHLRRLAPERAAVLPLKGTES